MRLLRVRGFFVAFGHSWVTERLSLDVGDDIFDITDPHLQLLMVTAALVWRPLLEGLGQIIKDFGTPSSHLASEVVLVLSKEF